MRNKLKNEKKRLRLKIKREAAHPNKMADEETDFLDNCISDNQADKENVCDATQIETVNEDSEPEELYGDLCDELTAKQKPGVWFPHDSCSSRSITSDLEATALTQYNLKHGLREFGKDGVTALGKEMEQLHTRKVGKPIHSSNLTRDQKKATLRYLMFLTQK